MTADPAVYGFGPYVLDRPRRLLMRDGSAVALTPKAFDLLTVLVENEGRLVSKETLMRSLWPDTVVEESNLTFQVSSLRKALGGDRYVVTVPGRGYQFTGAVERIAETPITETMVEQEERTTITVSDERRTIPWLAIGVAAALAVAVVLVTVLLIRRPPPAEPGVRSIAVLPFRPIVASQRDESLELGMADTLITRLSHIPMLIVRPTSAVRRYSALDQDPLAAGRELRVDAVLDGSIQRASDRVRVTVRLLRTADGTPLWATQFDQSVGDLFAVQDRVADGVARSIAPSLTGRQQQLLTKKATTDLGAYELYTQGLVYKELAPAKAQEYFQRAVTRDENFAAAWAAIAETWLFRGRFTNYPPHDFFANARTAAEKAIAIDPDLADAHAALAAVYGDYDWRWDDAEREYLQAIRLNPNNATAHSLYAFLLMVRHRCDDALRHVRRAAELDPLSFGIGVTHGFVLRECGRSDEAIQQLSAWRKRHPDITPFGLHLGMAYTSAGKPAEGAKVLRETLPIARNNSQLQALYAYALVKAGQRDEALRVIDDLEKLGKSQSVASVNLAAAYAALGNRDRAFYWLERAYRDHLYLLRVIAIDPAYEPLRGDPRYADLMRRMGL
jgi:DNA-binding winged helix-turn-helix (wHTH) protein/TolB-like protein/Tfp pilus assembly protein PilF